MDSIRVKAYAKINLTLDVLGKRPDGYHDLATIMHQIPLSDDIIIRIGGDPGIRATTNISYIRNDTNIAAKAAKLLTEKLGIANPSIAIEIHKRIPVGAGLGGGSADAAAVLTALSSYYKSGLSKDDLYDLGAKAGADVPFCIAGGCALCEGIGERITPIPPLKGGFLVLVKPRASISTAELFSEYRALPQQTRPDTAGAVRALQDGDFTGAAHRVCNVLEAAAEKKCGDIAEIRNNLCRLGAAGAAMSGSGSSVFGLFIDEKKAETAADFLKKQYRNTFSYAI